MTISSTDSGFSESLANTKFELCPVMPEGIGVFRLPENVHNEFRTLCDDVVINASDAQRRTGPSLGVPKLFHICNIKDQHLFKEFPALMPIKLSILNFANQYIKALGFECDQFVLTDAWINYGGEGAFLPYHIHANSFISGTYFVRLDERYHSKLNIRNDRFILEANRSPSLFMEPSKDRITPYNARNLVVGSEGDIVFWRSNLLHGYTEKNKKDGRVSLSFNLMPVECTDGETFSFRVEND